MGEFRGVSTFEVEVETRRSYFVTVEARTVSEAKRRAKLLLERDEIALEEWPSGGRTDRIVSAQQVAA
jgi:hypothetical protein